MKNARPIKVAFYDRGSLDGEHPDVEIQPLSGELVVEIEDDTVEESAM
jgi:hypothetical protein